MAARYVSEDGSGDGPPRLIGNPKPPEDEDNNRFPINSSSRLKFQLLFGSDFAVPLTDDILKECVSLFHWIGIHGLQQKEFLKLRDKLDDRLNESETETTVEYFSKATTRILVKFILEYVLENVDECHKALSAFDTVLLSSLRRESLSHEHYLAYSYYGYIEKINLYHRLGRTAEANGLFAQLMKMDLSHDKTTAAILAIKAQFLRALQLPPEQRRDILLQVIKLEPDFGEWQRQLFSALRRIRKERDFRSSPEEDEMNACLKSFDLDPHSIGAKCSMAILYEEILKADCPKGSFKNPLLVQLGGRVEMAKQMIAFARSAHDEHPNRKFNIRLAGMLSNDRIVGKELVDLEESERLFNHCLEKRPNNSHVLHKVGKFYMSAKKDSVRGVDCFKKALEANPYNFPCLMDYLRSHFRMINDTDSLRDQHSKFAELISLLDAHIPIFRLNSVLSGKLKSMKATLLWKLGNERESVDLWLEALAIDMNLDHQLIDDMGGETVFKNLLTTKDFQKVLKVMNARKEVDPSEIERGQPFQNFITSFEKQLEKRRFREVSNQSGEGNYRARYVSEGDLAADWRSHCSSSCAASNSLDSSYRNDWPQRGRQENSFNSPPSSSHQNQPVRINGYRQNTNARRASDIDSNWRKRN